MEGLHIPRLEPVLFDLIIIYMNLYRLKSDSNQTKPDQIRLKSDQTSRKLEESHFVNQYLFAEIQ